MIALEPSAFGAPKTRRRRAATSFAPSTIPPARMRRALPSAAIVQPHQPAPIAADAIKFEKDLLQEMTQLRRYAIRLCNSASLADDLMQETLLNAWMARDRFQPGTNLRAWCTTILRNVFISYKRRSWRMLPLADETLADTPARGTDCGDALDLLALRNVIALLPAEQREALLLVGVGGMSYIEAARVCACAVGTAKSRVSRARIRLVLLLAENKAGFSTDANLSADAAIDDLFGQVALIVLKPSHKSAAGISEPYIPILPRL